MYLANTSLINRFSRIVALVSVLIISISASAGSVDYRLPKHVIPTYQHIDLTLNPDLDDYSGKTRAVN